MIRIRLPYEYDAESLKDLFNDNIEDLEPALDLDVEERDMRAQYLQSEVNFVEINGDEVTLYYEVEYNAYYGCKDIDGAGTYEEEVTGTIRDGYVVFNPHVTPERLAPNEEL